MEPTQQITITISQDELQTILNSLALSYFYSSEEKSKAAPLYKGLHSKLADVKKVA